MAQLRQAQLEFSKLDKYLAITYQWYSGTFNGKISHLKKLHGKMPISLRILFLDSSRQLHRLGKQQANHHEDMSTLKKGAMSGY